MSGSDPSVRPPKGHAARIREAVARAAHLLPAQGPIGVFIHHNTLHAFENLTFDDAVRKGAQVFGCEPFLAEDRYREELRRGRILFSELREVLRQDLGRRSDETLQGLSTRWELRLAMLEHPLRMGEGPELDWLMAESDALDRARPDVSEVSRRRLVTATRHWVMCRLRSSAPEQAAPEWAARLFRRFQEGRMEEWDDARWESFSLAVLWEVCVAGVSRAAERVHVNEPPLRHRDRLLAAGGADSDLLVHEHLVRFCGAFLDQGIAHAELPRRDEGFFKSFCRLYADGRGSAAWWSADLGPILRDIERRGLSPEESLGDSLAALGVQEEETEAFVAASLLALKGWAGMLWHVEQRSDRVHRPVPPGTLVEFLAVRLLLERLALRAVARDSLGLDLPLTELRDELWLMRSAAPEDRDKQRAFLVFQLAQVLGWAPESLFRLSPSGWTALLLEIEGFSSFERRRIFHLAYEHRFRVQTLDALALSAARRSARSGRPSFQAVFCIDEREESVRRHLEEVAPACETFGAAGFFGVVMYYRGAAAADFVPLCPVVVRPAHWISERVERSQEREADRRRAHRRRLGMALRGFHGGSRRMVGGAFFSAALGLLATVPLVMQVLFPRLSAKVRSSFGRFIEPPPATRLQLERTGEAPSPHEDGHGFSCAERLAIAERLLGDLGLRSEFARLVLIFGHGSTSMNNPHESAHDCGACGGGRGGPNARAAAEILNDPRVRSGLRAKGFTVPEDTVFVGGMHNTSSDDFAFYDTDRVPSSLRQEFDAARAAVEEAARRNAHERARRFGSASLGLDHDEAKRHMEARAEDLSQVRPEWGHATNAVCVVGRRDRTRGLFLDRRAFLVSYDPDCDSEGVPVLSRILGAVVPVCSGINLEYYFSYVDSPGWGSGSKLPHNITGLLGVMDGAQSDLRTGLPWQMVEIHEPLRLLFVVEASQDAVLGVMRSNPAVRAAVANRWVQLAVMDPATGAIALYREGAFEPHRPAVAALPAAASSREWYAGWRDHLEFAEIKPPAA